MFFQKNIFLIFLMSQSSTNKIEKAARLSTKVQHIIVQSLNYATQ